MIASISTLAGAVLLMLLAPRVLTVGNWQVRHPRTALTAWFGALCIGTGLVVASVVIAVIAATQAASAALAAPGSGGGTLVTVLAWVGLTGLGAGIGLLSGLSEPLASSHRRAIGRVAPIATSREDRGAFTLVRFSADEPIAIAVPGRRPEILLSNAMTEALTSQQLGAVLAHEFAHLRHRHGLVVRVAELNARFLPSRFAVGQALRSATLLLVELIADDVAARQAGALTLASALQRIGTVSGDPGMLLRADRLKAFRDPAVEPKGLPQPVRI